MASRFVNPFPQFLDSTPEVRAGAKLFFYAAGTSTKLNTYSDRTLTTPNTNPIILNSSGNSSTDIYLQDLDYKVVLAPSTDSDPPAAAIWSADYVRGRDSALIAKTLTGSGSPNGSVAGTAGSASILPDFYWDYTNSILYVCTTTGTSSTAVWTAINASAATPSVPTPQGRLTPTSATPVISTGVTSGTAVYYTPYVGNLIPIYNGSTMVPTEFSELTLTLSSSHATNTIYDVFVFSNSGVLTLVTGPAWTTSTTGSGARGSGASTTELTRIKGLNVNAVSMTARNGSTTYTVGANLGTYVGSIYIDGTAGQVTCHIAYGQSRKWAVWNAYNRTPVWLRCGDATASWNYTTATIRAANNNSANSLTTFSGLAEDFCYFEYSVAAGSSSAAASAFVRPLNYIGYNSSTTPAGTAGSFTFQADSGNIAPVICLNVITARHAVAPSLGANVVVALENGNTSTANTFFGTETNMLLSARWMA
jgi:hypothetical protein